MDSEIPPPSGPDEGEGEGEGEGDMARETEIETENETDAASGAAHSDGTTAPEPQEPAAPEPTAPEEPIPDIPKGMVYCRALKSVIVRGVVKNPGERFFLEAAEALRAFEKQAVEVLAGGEAIDALPVEKYDDHHDGMLHCRAIKTCLARGIAVFPPDTFWVTPEEALRAVERGAAELIVPDQERR